MRRSARLQERREKSAAVQSPRSGTLPAQVREMGGGGTSGPKRRSRSARTSASRWAPSASPSFAPFLALPAELRLAIWESAADSLSERVPEACIVWPLALDGSDLPHLPLVVDTAWPALMHVCRESRQVALRSPHLRLRFSPAAGFAVPFRIFDPEIDTLHFGCHQLECLYRLVGRSENRPLLRLLRHLSVEAGAADRTRTVTDFIVQSAPALRTLALVFADSTNLNYITTTFMPPAGRCRLRDIPRTVAGSMYVRGRTDYHLQDPTMRSSPWRLVDRYRQGLVRSVAYSRLLVLDDDEDTAWLEYREERDFSALQIKIQTFVEYKWTRSGGEQWVEVCGRRKLGYRRESRPRCTPVAERRKPEEYRVLDVDTAWPPPVALGGEGGA